MSEGVGNSGASTEPSKVGPDYFAFYAQEIEKLLSMDEDFLPLSPSQASKSAETRSEDEKDVNGHILLNGKKSSIVSGSFSQGIGGELSDFKKERLKSLLQQTVVSLSREVDDMLDPVLAIRHLQSQLRSRKILTNQSAAASEGDVQGRPGKKIRFSSSSSSGSDFEVGDAGLPEKEIINDAKSCVLCHTTKTPMWRRGPKGFKSLCNACGLKSKNSRQCKPVDDRNTLTCRVSNTEATTESKERDDDLRFLIENNSVSVESSIKKYSDDLLMTLENMEQHLEGLLDSLQSSNSLQVDDSY